MPRAKSKSQPDPGRTSVPADANGVSREVLTLSEAAGYLRLAETEVLRMVREQNLHARQVGQE
jgi:hypothetical protein